MSQRRNMTDLDLAERRVLIREDLNVPIRDGRITSDARVRAALPTIEAAMRAGARTLVMSHLGRPVEGEFDPALSLAPVAGRLGELLGVDVPLVGLDDVGVIDPGAVSLLENVRFLKGEGADDEALARRLASLCDIYVMDAFATAHRAQASTHGVAKFAPVACAGPLLAGELEALERALRAPARPMTAIVGGAKVSTKLEVLDTLATIADRIIVGGGIANTFIAAAGHPVGRSLYEEDLLEAARSIAAKVEVPLPVDVMVGERLDAGAVAVLRGLDEVRPESGDGPTLRGRAWVCGHHSLERPAGRLRVRPVRRGHSRGCPGHRVQRCVLHSRRRGYPGSHRQVRRARWGVLHLHRGRRVPRVRGGQDPARRGRPREPG
jgi:phosphoglycerate kinase